MEGRITDKGNLVIKRGGLWKGQSCPYNDDESCNDYCPLFREPYTFKPSLFKDQVTILKLCNALLSFDHFEDERIE